MKYSNEFVKFMEIYVLVNIILFLVVLIKNIYCKCYANETIVDSFFDYVLFSRDIFSNNIFSRNNYFLIKNIVCIYGIYIVCSQFDIIKTLFILSLVNIFNLLFELTLCYLFNINCTLGFSNLLISIYFLDYLINKKINILLCLFVSLHFFGYTLISNVPIYIHLTGIVSGIISGIMSYLLVV